MSGDPQEPLSLDSVREPAGPPPEAPDERTEEERNADEKEFALDHLNRMLKAPYRAIYVAEREYKLLSEQVRDMSAELRRLHEEVEREGPQYAIMRQALHDLRGTFSVAALLMTAGGVSVSIAGAISDTTWRPITLYGGIATALVGLFLTLFSLVWIKPQS